VVNSGTASYSPLLIHCPFRFSAADSLIFDNFCMERRGRDLNPHTLCRQRGLRLGVAPSTVLSHLSIQKTGAPDGTRTRDLSITNRLLSGDRC
jgi:hypothetical protein